LSLIQPAGVPIELADCTKRSTAAFGVRPENPVQLERDQLARSDGSNYGRHVGRGERCRRENPLSPPARLGPYSSGDHANYCNQSSTTWKSYYLKPDQTAAYKHVGINPVI
jgi:hypothetical protein